MAGGAIGGAVGFLSHLSGDEEQAINNWTLLSFLSHLSGDEGTALS